MSSRLIAYVEAAVSKYFMKKPVGKTYQSCQSVFLIMLKGSVVAYNE